MNKNSWDMVGALVLVMLAVVLTYAIGKRACDETPLVRPQPHAPASRLKLVYVTSKSCRFCDKFERQTLGNAAVAARIAGSYSFLKLDGRDAAAYGVTGYPAYLLFDDGRELRRGTGYRSPTEFLAWLDGNAGQMGDGAGCTASDP